MLFTENVLVALAGLKANIMRSLLTMLGIIIGIASVIAIMTVGNSGGPEKKLSRRKKEEKIL